MSNKGDFPIQNLPYGVFQTHSQSIPRLATAFKDNIVDVSGLAQDGKFAKLAPKVQDALKNHISWNEFASFGRQVQRDYRRVLTQIILAEDQSFINYLYPIQEVTLLLPVKIGDYTDFWCSEVHALNGCKINRNMDRLPPVWYRLPGGYMGRVSSIGVNQEINRPKGQLAHASEGSHFTTCGCLDFEVELAWVTGKGNDRGVRISVDRAEEHLFGAMLMNDWSARDFARFEVQAGGVTTCKNFATTVAPWIVSIEALEPFKIVLPPQVPEPVSYLTGKMSRISYDINLRAEVGNRGQYTLATETHLKHVYWSPAQMIAHFTVSGANFRPGDIFATGTISGPEQSTWGCLMEKTWGGARSWNGPNGESKVWLEDGDDVIIQAYCEGNGVRIGFGKCAGLILPAIT